ncbi:MAG: 50S ribosome-binding GTPase [Planctomycetes bacterium]|nr:50S ribosome-binding GTPase [Planctomycetota bacterium]
MSLHAELVALEREIDQVENALVRRHGESLRPPVAPPRVENLPADLLLVGLVGGTGVGKSTLVNALAGHDISRTSARRPTTDRIIPYLHRRRLALIQDLDFLRESLTETIRPHDIDALEHIVILDLPDIDSSERSHAEVVERVLGGLDLVVWVTSLTKYSDRLFHDWIERHSRGREIGNFLFYLNKIDEIDQRDGPEAATEVALRFRAAVRDSLGGRGAALLDQQFYTGAATRPEARLPGNRVLELRSELFRERDALEIQRLKSSDRLALAANRLDHLATALDLDARHERLAAEFDRHRGRFGKVAEEKDLRAEFADRLIASSAAEEATRPIMRRMLARWPLLPQLAFLTRPLRQLARLGRLPALLLPGEEETRAELPLLRARLRDLDRERRSQESLRLDTEDIERPPLETEEIDLLLKALETEAVAELRVRAQEAPGPAEPEGFVTRLGRRVLVWFPLVWFPLLQPILQDVLDPDRSAAGLPPRILYRLVRMLGAQHLLISLAFVLAVYVVILLLVQAAARRRALRSCRELERGSWWSTSLVARLEELFLGPALRRMNEIVAERDELGRLRDGLGDLRRRIDQGS